MRYCKRCRRYTVHRLDPFPFAAHVLHGLLCVGSCGLWLPFYLFFCISKEWRCERCGR